MNDIVVIYNEEPVLVSREVADYLEEERKRDQAETRQDRRHLSKSEFETVSDCAVPIRRPVEDACIKNLRLEKLRNAVKQLDDQEQKLIDLRYKCYMTEEQVGEVFGICRMAASKRLKQLHEKRRSSVVCQGSVVFYIFRFTSDF